MSSFALQELHATNFRNINHLCLNVSPGLNLFIGDNGQGKTNVLEAIAIACSLRPMQSLSNSDLIQQHQAQAHIAATFCDHHIAITILPTGKKARLNDVGVKSAQAVAKLRPVVSFIPQELTMISGCASLRRRALDQAAASLYFEHYAAVKAYEKTLHHRNRLLKSWPRDERTLASFTKLLIKEGAGIIYHRLKTIEALSEPFQERLSQILGTHQHATLSYTEGGNPLKYQTSADLCAVLSSRAQQCEQQEYHRKVTLFGPHLDDLSFNLNGLNARTHASRGQMRALVLAFKLAHMLAIFYIRQHAPVIILDDIISELDNTKKANLIELIAQLEVQAFFSATDLSAFQAILPKPELFEVEKGNIQRV